GSVLVLQGRGERLLDSSPKGRFEVLAGIVDLERYERLHHRADEERKALDARVKNAQGRLAALPEVSSIALLEAEGQIDAADKERLAAQAEWDRWRGLEGQAQPGAGLQKKPAPAPPRGARTGQNLGRAAGRQHDRETLTEP